MKTLNFDDILSFRKKLGLNQSTFWGAVCTTQSGGSRYESGRSIPVAIKVLLHQVYVEKQDISKIVKAVKKK